MKTLNDYFTKLYCINLDRRPDRYKECSAEFDKINANVERISAIDGKLLSNVNTRMAIGAYALLLTHKKILEDAISNQYKSILIFEDDVTFINNFNEAFNKKIEFLPQDWDMLYLGGNNVFYGGMFKLITGDRHFKVNKQNYKTLNYELCKTTWTQCAHAVAFSLKFYKPLLSGMNRYLETPIDAIHVGLQREGYNAYTFLPSLAIQRPSFSDIENDFTYYAGSDLNSF